MGDDTRRSVTVRRTAAGQLVATNQRGGELSLGAADTDFTPVELLLVAIGACSALDVDALTSRRAEPESFEVQVAGDKVRDETGNRMENLQVTFRVTFGGGAAGDAARAVLPDMIARSHDRLCTVTRTVEHATPVDSRLV
jgi:putative redox protein